MTGSLDCCCEVALMDGATSDADCSWLLWSSCKYCSAAPVALTGGMTGTTDVTPSQASEATTTPHQNLFMFLNMGHSLAIV